MSTCQQQYGNIPIQHDQHLCSLLIAACHRILLTKYGFESRMLHENTKKLDENIPWTMNSVQVYIYSFKTMRLAIMDCHPGWWESYQDQESSDGRYMKVLYLEMMYTRIGFLLFLASGVPFFWYAPNTSKYYDIPWLRWWKAPQLRRVWLKGN